MAAYVIPEITGIPEFAGSYNGAISLARGDKLGAALSFAAMTPVVGSVASAGGKLARFGLKKADDVLAAGKFAKCKVTGTGCFVAGTKVWVTAEAEQLALATLAPLSGRWNGG